MQLTEKEVTMSLLKDYLIPFVIIVGIALAATLAIGYFKPKSVTEPIVCIQDAPVTYDWNNNLIVEGMKE